HHHQISRFHRLFGVNDWKLAGLAVDNHAVALQSRPTCPARDDTEVFLAHRLTQLTRHRTTDCTQSYQRDRFDFIHAFSSFPAQTKAANPYLSWTGGDIIQLDFLYSFSAKISSR